MERRNHPRVAVSHPIHYHRGTGPGIEVSSTLDLSMGGVGIDTSCRLAMGEILDISIAIPPQVIKCKVRVVHVLRLIGKRLKAGLRFEEMSRKDRLCLGDYISFAVGQQEATKPLKGLIIGLIISFLVWAAIIYAILVLF
jgi:hypothetical protein